MFYSADSGRNRLFLLTATLVLAGVFTLAGDCPAQGKTTIRIESELGDSLLDSLGEEALTHLDTIIEVEKYGGALRVTHSPNDVVQVGGDVTIKEGIVVDGDAVCIGGVMNIYGEVDGDAVCIGGSITVHPDARVTGDAVSIGGKVRQLEGAKVEGQVVSLAPGFGAFFPWSRAEEERSVGVRMGDVILNIVITLIILFFFILIFVDLLSGPTERVGAQVRNDSVKTGFVGLLVLLLTPVICVVLAISILGIPLIPVYCLALVVALIWGFISSSLEAGRIWGAKLFPSITSPRMMAFIGVLLLLTPKFLGKILISIGGPVHILGWSLAAIGSVVVLLAVFAGVGGVVFSRFGRRDMVGAEPLAGETPIAGELTDGDGSIEP